MGVLGLLESIVCRWVWFGVLLTDEFLCVCVEGFDSLKCVIAIGRRFWLGD